MGSKQILKTFVALTLFFAAPSQASQTLFSGGMGLTFSPSMFLLSPQIEVPAGPRLLVGPLIQLGLSSVTLATFSGTARYILGNDPKLKPSIEGGLGLAVASNFAASSIGACIQFGMGFDYRFSPAASIGTVLRLNFLPPLTTLVVSWSLVTFRVWL